MANMWRICRVSGVETIRIRASCGLSQTIFRFSTRSLGCIESSSSPLSPFPLSTVSSSQSSSHRDDRFSQRRFAATICNNNNKINHGVIMTTQLVRMAKENVNIRLMSTGDESTKRTDHKVVEQFEQMLQQGLPFPKLKSFVKSELAGRDRDPSSAALSSTGELRLLICALLRAGCEKDDFSIVSWSLKELDRRRFHPPKPLIPLINQTLSDNFQRPKTTAAELAPALVYAVKSKQIDKLLEFTKLFVKKEGWSDNKEELRLVVDVLIDNKDASTLLTFLSMTGTNKVKN
eukprot:TRINITY_DN16524_c0_g1_i1.p1 TRINITY_DN16524_c0_g1~~TRINITY_DN16524_c0_g1_i1.p1  ORF type:complete len:300 (+),score=48.30 TRINITY_DN16524_c0_g1_i1:31-900(+)